MILKILFRRIAYRLQESANGDMRRVVSHPHLVSGLSGASISARARLSVDEDTPGHYRIILGKNVYLCGEVELAALAGGDVIIGDDSSLQGGCLVGGDVRIGAHCLFGKNVVVSSTTHRFRDRPTWLIRDQDRLSWREPRTLKTPRSRRIIIEDDCWIGQGVVINPGVTIGRGAVVGANSVVTCDINPYEIYGGVPARRIGARLEFTPPPILDAQQDDHIPYFYRGFRLTQTELAAGRTHGVVYAREAACLLLMGGSGTLRMQGNSVATQALDIRINGISCGLHEVEDTFDLRLPMPQAHTSHALPLMLQRHTMVEIFASVSYGVSCVMLEAA